MQILIAGENLLVLVDVRCVQSAAGFTAAAEPAAPLRSATSGTCSNSTRKVMQPGEIEIQITCLLLWNLCKNGSFHFAIERSATSKPDKSVYVKKPDMVYKEKYKNLSAGGLLAEGKRKTERKRAKCKR
jgi:hypothetical protein